MMVWQVYREGDGPFKALKSLGKDLQSGNPYTANDNLIRIASAIVRNQIANATIDQVLTDRAFMRDAIRKEMGKLVQGWGVWLETVEITDVKILSSSLFRNLQTEFRETNRKDAEIIKMEADTAINYERKQKELEKSKRDVDTKKKQNAFQNQRKVAMAKEAQRSYEKECELAKKKEKEANSVSLFKYKNSITEDQNIAQTNHESTLKGYQNEIVEIEAIRKKQLAELEI